MHLRVVILVAVLLASVLPACAHDWTVRESDAEAIAAVDASDAEIPINDGGSVSDANLPALDTGLQTTADASSGTGTVDGSAVQDAMAPLSACQTTKSCALGEACASETECAAGGVCDLQKTLCLADCGPVNIVTKSDLDKNRYCRKITGDLTLSATFNEIDSHAFPYLEEISGRLVGNSSALTTVTLSALRRITQSFLPVAANSSIQLVSMPSLESVGSPGFTDVHFGFGWGAVLDLPKLQTVHGAFSTSFALETTAMRLPKLQAVSGDLTILAPKLTVLDLSALRSIGGTLSLSNLLRLPWSSLQGVVDGTTASSKRIDAIGCCTPSEYMCVEATNYGC